MVMVHDPSSCPCMSISPTSPRPGTPATTSAWWSAQRNRRRCGVSGPPRLTCGSSSRVSAPRAAIWNQRSRAGLRADGKGLADQCFPRHLPCSRTPAQAAAELRDEMINIQYQRIEKRRQENVANAGDNLNHLGLSVFSTLYSRRRSSGGRLCQVWRVHAQIRAEIPHLY